MADTLPVKPLKRRVRIVAFTAAGLCAVLAYGWWVGDSAGRTFDQHRPATWIMICFALLTTTWLTAGWWRQSERILASGLFLAGWVWAIRTAYIAIDAGGSNTAERISGLIAMMLFGSWMAESWRPRGHSRS